MSGLFERLRAQRPKTIKRRAESAALDIPDNLWVKCNRCGAAVFRKAFDEQLKVCDKCGHHHKLSAQERVETLADTATFVEWGRSITPTDPLQFGPEYTRKLEEDRRKTALSDAALTGQCQIGGFDCGLGVMDFGFRGGSMGSVVGEKITALFERACTGLLPVVVVTSSGGARMQEGILSLMQMAKTSAARMRLTSDGLPYIVVLTDPTTAGVAASFAALGDVILAEPNAIIGFSGARVIEQTIRQKLPEGFQTSEFYLKHGFIDRVVARKDLKITIARLLGFLTRNGTVACATE